MSDDNELDVKVVPSNSDRDEVGRRDTLDKLEVAPKGHQKRKRVLHAIERPLDSTLSWVSSLRTLAISTFLCLAALLTVVGLYASSQRTSTASQSALTPGQYVNSCGFVFPYRSLDLSFSSNEHVTGVLVRAGDHVVAGQTLIQLDPKQLNAPVVQAANDLGAAAVYLNNALATNNQATIAQAKQAYNLAKDKYDAAVNKLSSPFLHNNDLISPMKGIVSAVNINAGDSFAANVSLLTIVDESAVTVHLKIPLDQLGRVLLGQHAVVTPSPFPNQMFQGTVTTLIPQVNSDTASFEAWVEVDNPKITLLPGITACVRIQTDGNNQQ